jgi:Fe-Mn family superoxide dismutase
MTPTPLPLALPDLPYAADALEPWCPAETLALHHGKHHATYVKGAQTAIDALAEVDPTDTVRLAALHSSYVFNYGGHVLHSLFWTSICPDVTAPSGALAEAIARDMGSTERVQTVMRATASTVQGTGWVLLVADGGRVRVIPATDHQHDHVPGSVLLAAVDVWEHAYYLTFKNDRASWTAAAVEHLDWASIGARFEAIG